MRKFNIFNKYVEFDMMNILNVFLYIKPII